MAQKHILKINYALSSRPLYVSVEDPAMSMDGIFKEAVQSLADSGRSQESIQLSQLYSEHQIFNESQAEVSKGATFAALETKPMVVQDQTVDYAEVTLSTKHVGGI
jgi:hypothetical protein